MNRPRKTKEEQDQEEQDKILEKKQAAIEAQKDGQALRNTFATVDGRKALLILMKKMKYQSPITLVTHDGVIHDENLQHNAALQGMYLWLRKYIDRETLIAVEVDGLEEGTEE